MRDKYAKIGGVIGAHVWILAKNGKRWRIDRQREVVKISINKGYIKGVLKGGGKDWFVFDQSTRLFT